MAVTGSILASIFRRDCACPAFVALEAIDGRLQVPPLVLLFLFLFELDCLLFAALLLKTRIIGPPKGELGLVEVKDMIANGIQ
jgi:hypothetical protein